MDPVERADVPEHPAVLVVDAARDEREMYATALAFQGYDVRQAATSAEALEDIRTLRPDVIVADVCLPVIGGLDLLRLIRRNQETCDIPVIILSGYGGTLGELSEAATLGANAVRVKPLAPESLGNDIAQIVGQSRKLREASADMRMRAAELREQADGVLERASRARARAGKVLARAMRFRGGGS